MSVDLSNPMFRVDPSSAQAEEVVIVPELRGIYRTLRDKSEKVKTVVSQAVSVLGPWSEPAMLELQREKMEDLYQAWNTEVYDHLMEEYVDQVLGPDPYKGEAWMKGTDA